MPKSPETQQLLDEVKAPSHSKRQDVEGVLGGFLRELMKCGQQAGEIRTRAQLANIAEEDPDLRDSLELYLQTAGAIQRSCGKIEAEARLLIVALRQMERYDADVREKAVAKGYER